MLLYLGSDYVHSVSHWLTDSNKNSKSSLLLAFSIIKNILPLVEGVMVDYHKREKYITLWKKNITRDEVEGDILFPECDISSRVWSSTITPSTKGKIDNIKLFKKSLKIPKGQSESIY